jgi:hypothetical protein
MSRTRSLLSSSSLFRPFPVLAHRITPKSWLRRDIPQYRKQTILGTGRRMISRSSYFRRADALDAAGRGSRGPPDSFTGFVLAQLGQDIGRCLVDHWGDQVFAVRFGFRLQRFREY